MKAIIVALALVALAYGDDDDSCTPGSTKMIECNHCWCLENGSGWACTLKGCSTYVLTIDTKNDSPSEPEAADSSKRSRRDAKSSEESSEDSKSIEHIQVCEPGATKNVDCNSCFCTNDGAGWACTRKGCVNRTVVVADSGSPDTTATPA